MNYVNVETFYFQSNSIPTLKFEVQTWTFLLLFWFFVAWQNDLRTAKITIESKQLVSPLTQPLSVSINENQFNARWMKTRFVYYLNYFKRGKIKEKKFSNLNESFCVGAWLKYESSEHIRFYTKYLCSKINHIYRWINYLFSPLPLKTGMTISRTGNDIAIA